MSKIPAKNSLYTDIIVLNPRSVKSSLSSISEKRYLSQLKLKDFFSEIIKLYMNSTQEEKQSFFETKLLNAVKQKMPLSKNYQFISRSIIQRYLFLKSLTTIFTINVSEVIGLEYFQFVQLLCNDFQPLVYKNCLIIYSYTYLKSPPMKFTDEFSSEEIQELYYANRYSMKKLIQLFTHYFFFLELVNAVISAHQQLGENPTLGQLVERLRKESESIAFFDCFAHLLFKALMLCSLRNWEAEPSHIIFKLNKLDEFLDDSSTFHLHELLSCLLTKIPETSEAYKSFERQLNSDEQFFENLHGIVINDHEVNPEEDE